MPSWIELIDQKPRGAQAPRGGEGRFKIKARSAAIGRIPAIIEKRSRQKKLYKKTDAEILNQWNKYLGQSKSSGGGTVSPYKKL